MITWRLSEVFYSRYLGLMTCYVHMNIPLKSVQKYFYRHSIGNISKLPRHTNVTCC